MHMFDVSLWNWLIFTSDILMVSSQKTCFVFLRNLSLNGLCDRLRSPDELYRMDLLTSERLTDQHEHLYVIFLSCPANRPTFHNEELPFEQGICPDGFLLVCHTFVPGRVMAEPVEVEPPIMVS